VIYCELELILRIERIFVGISLRIAIMGTKKMMLVGKWMRDFEIGFVWMKTLECKLVELRYDWKGKVKGYRLVEEKKDGCFVEFLKRHGSFGEPEKKKKKIYL